MGTILIVTPIILGGIVGIILDVKYRIESPNFYWLLGNFGCLAAWGLSLYFK